MGSWSLPHVASRVVAWGVMMVIISGLMKEAEAMSMSKRSMSVPIQPASVQVVVDGSKPIATVGDEFICATLDWWSDTKCDYGSCPWYNVSILNLDLTNPILEQAMKALAPLKVRIGGTLQDVIEYNIGSLIEPCLPLIKNDLARFGFSGGCLSIQRWDLLNQFFKETGVSVAFGLNALYGRPSNGSWDPSNAAEFILYTHDQGYPVTAWELGRGPILFLQKPQELLVNEELSNHPLENFNWNELMGGSNIGLQITPQLYADNVKMLRTIVNRIYEGDSMKALVVAPDSFYEVGDPDLQNFLADSGPYVVDVLTRHMYNLGPGNTSTDQLVEAILNQSISDGEEERYAGLQAVLGGYPWASAWVGEAGGAYNSGHENVTDAFIMAFWYLDQLGLASKHNNQAFCRQSLIGGHYGLLDAISYRPNPDYYGALLWHELMGNDVLSVNVNSNDIRAYAHCHKESTKGGVTVLLLNYSNETYYSVDFLVLGHLFEDTHMNQKVEGEQKSRVPLESLDPLPHLVFHMTPAEGDIHSHVVLLNGRPLRVTSTGGIPKLEGLAVNKSTPVTLEPLTYTFVVLQGCSATACFNG